MRGILKRTAPFQFPWKQKATIHFNLHCSISISTKAKNNHPFQFTIKQKETSPMVTVIQLDEFKSRLRLISLPLAPTSHSFSSFHFHVRIHFLLSSHVPALGASFLFVWFHYVIFMLFLLFPFFYFHVLDCVHHFFSSCFLFVLVRTTMVTFLYFCGAPNFHILIWFECIIIAWSEKINVSALNRHYPKVT